MTLYLLRHASVDERYVGKYNGHIDISLSDRGEREAKEAARRLSCVGFDAVFCSDLLRCRQTLAPFGFLNVVFDERLREKSWGRGEGLCYDEICERFGVSYAGDFEAFARSIGGESLEGFYARVFGFFEELKAIDASNVLVATHGGVIRALLAKLRGLSLEESFCIEVSYASITVLEDFA